MRRMLLSKDEAKLEAFIRKHCAKETKKEWGLSD